jgi:hypothetical protein
MWPCRVRRDIDWSSTFRLHGRRAIALKAPLVQLSAMFSSDDGTSARPVIIATFFFVRAQRGQTIAVNHPQHRLVGNQYVQDPHRRCRYMFARSHWKTRACGSVSLAPDRFASSVFGMGDHPLGKIDSFGAFAGGTLD